MTKSRLLTLLTVRVERLLSIILNKEIKMEEYFFLTVLILNLMKTEKNKNHQKKN